MIKSCNFSSLKDKKKYFTTEIKKSWIKFSIIIIITQYALGEIRKELALYSVTTIYLTVKLKAKYLLILCMLIACLTSKHFAMFKINRTIFTECYIFLTFELASFSSLSVSLKSSSPRGVKAWVTFSRALLLKWSGWNLQQ